MPKNDPEYQMLFNDSKKVILLKPDQYFGEWDTFISRLWAG